MSSPKHASFQSLSSSGVKAVLYTTSRHGGSTTTVFIKIHYVTGIYYMYLPMMQVNCTIGFLDFVLETRKEDGSITFSIKKYSANFVWSAAAHESKKPVTIQPLSKE